MTAPTDGLRPRDRRGHRPRLRLGVIGAGSWAVESHLPAFSRHYDVVEPTIVNRRDPIALEAIRTRFGFVRSSTRWQDVIAERPDIVVIASPGGLHHEQAAAALDAGAHVLCEKPFTLAATDGWDLVARAARAAREVVVAFGWNYRPMILQAERLMATDGGIGEIEQLTITMASATRTLLGGIGADRHQAPTATTDGSMSVEPRPETWRDADLSGGGYGQAQLSHALGLALRLTGLRGREVFAYLGAVADGIELHDAIAIRYANGAIGTISGASNHGSGEGKHQLELRVIGARGQLLVDLEREAVWRYRSPSDDVRIPLESGDGRYEATGPVDAIVELALGSGTNRSSAELGARTVEILEAAYASATSHTPATINENVAT